MFFEIRELQTQRATLIKQAQTILRNGTASAENNAKVEKMLRDADEIESRIERVREEERTAKVERARAARNPQPGSLAPQKEAIRNYILTGEKRGLTTSNTSAGYIVGQAFDQTLHIARKSWGQLAGAVHNIKTDHAQPMRTATLNDTGNVAVEIAENTQASEADPLLGGQVMTPSLLTSGVVQVSIPELLSSEFDVDALIRDALAKRLYRGVAKYVSQGSPSGSIQSIVTTAQNGPTSASPTAVGYADLVALYSALDPAYLANAKWRMSAAVRNSLLGITDTLNRPLFVPAVSKDDLDQILGHDIVIDQFAPAMASDAVGAVSFGDLEEGYTLRQAGDFAILRLDERYADAGMVGFILYSMWSGWATVANTSVPPIVNLVQHA